MSPPSTKELLLACAASLAVSVLTAWIVLGLVAS